MIEVLARSGQHAFLIGVGNGLATVLSIEDEPFLAAPLSIDTVLSRGYWELFSGDGGPILELARRVATEGDELPGVGWDARRGARRLAGIKVEPLDLAGVVVSAQGPVPVEVERHGIFVGFGSHVRRRDPDTAGAR